ncbi:MAG TPA: helix-turn-helix transcriptional regulator [Pseudonocardia sp.]|nr:helix-turn-helix transcriptional regulator [Pseudonocardia sp.]
MIAAQPGPGAGLPDPASQNGPTALRIALGAHLRHLRESQGISREVAGDVIRASEAKISRLELGRVGFKKRDVADLLTLYGISDPEQRQEFFELVEQANSPGWWHRYNDVTPRWFELYLGLEQSASVIRSYEAQFVPGLLQTPDYVRGVMGHGNVEAAAVQRRIDLRLKRQEILERPGSPKLWIVIEEAALCRPVVEARVRREQMRHLIEVAQRPSVTIQMVPRDFAGHAATGLPFTLLRFDHQELPDVVYIEHLTSALYLDKRQDVDHYAAALDSLCAQVLPPDRTLSAFERIAAEL